MKRVLPILMFLSMGFQICLPQNIPEDIPGSFNRLGRWSLGGHGGINVWMSDFDKLHPSGTFDGFLRYSLSRHFSLGVMGGYDVLQALSTEAVRPPEFRAAETYIDTKGFSGDLVAWIHFNAGKSVSPYMYAGGGIYRYKRHAPWNVPWPKDETVQTMHIPFGFGIEFAASKHMTISLDLGARILDDATDNWAGADNNLIGTDWFGTARAGLNLYFGSSDDDDDDEDGLTNGYENKIGTNPDLADTDRDKLSDRDEVIRYRTSPLKQDTDVDGLIDGDEVLTHHTDPRKMDSDGDLLKDSEEVLTQHTDPFKVDTDGDGLTDGEEVTQYKTKPLEADTDGDALKDLDEVKTYRTDPLKADTDGGTVNDGVEVARKSNPLDPRDDVPRKDVIKAEVGKAIVLKGVVFASGKYSLLPESEAILATAYNTLVDNPSIIVEIRGYTDNVGSRSSNMRLSAARANAVRDWLVTGGIDGSRIRAKGYGPDNPIADNRTAAGRQLNRRIEFYRIR